MRTLAAGLFPALAAVINDLAGDSEPARAAGALAAGSTQLAEALHELEHHPRASELITAGEHANTIWLGLVEQIAAFSAPARPDEPRGDLERVDRLIRDFHGQAIAQLQLAGQLAAGGDPALALARHLGVDSETLR